MSLRPITSHPLLLLFLRVVICRDGLLFLFLFQWWATHSLCCSSLLLLMVFPIPLQSLSGIAFDSHMVLQATYETPKLSSLIVPRFTDVDNFGNFLLLLQPLCIIMFRFFLTNSLLFCYSRLVDNNHPVLKLLQLPARSYLSPLEF